MYTITNSAGEVEATGTLSSGGFGSDEVCGLRIECYTMTVSAGEYPSEVSWTVTQAEWSRGEGGAAATVGGICMQGMCTVVGLPHRQPPRPRRPRSCTFICLMSCPRRTATLIPSLPSMYPSEIPACDLRDEPQDSDGCHQQSSSGAWEGYSCADTGSFCTTWAKDVQRCCPEKCGTGALDEGACNALNSGGVCKYPNEAQCSGKTLPSQLPYKLPAEPTNRSCPRTRLLLHT